MVCGVVCWASKGGAVVSRAAAEGQSGMGRARQTQEMEDEHTLYQKGSFVCGRAGVMGHILYCMCTFQSKAYGPKFSLAYRQPTLGSLQQK